jgi:hypothetical protein
MYRFIWLVPLLPLIGAAINGIFGRWFRFPEKLIGGIAVGSVALSFLISLTAVYSYGFGSEQQWPKPYVTTQTAFTWIAGGAVRQSLGQESPRETAAYPPIHSQEELTRLITEANGATSSIHFPPSSC